MARNRAGAGSVAPIHIRLSIVLFGVALVVGCVTTGSEEQTGGTSASAPETSKVIEESLKNLSIASPRSLVQAETALGESTSGYSSRGLELSYIAYKMIQILYPLYLKPEYVIFPPSASIFPELFNAVQNGTFPTVKQSDVSFLTLIIPPLSVLYSNRTDVVDSSLEALDHAESLNPSSVLPPYLKGFVDEREGNTNGALSNYERAIKVDDSCYPAVIGKARILIEKKQYNEAEVTLQNLLASIPPDGEVYRLQAETQYALASYTSAKEAVARSLQLSPNNRAALVLAAKIYRAEKEYSKALDELSLAEKQSGPTPTTILLRAQVQKESGNPQAAAQVLASGIKLFPGNKEISDAYGKALIETGKAAEGGKYLTQTATQNPAGADNLELLVTKAIESKDWTNAEVYLSRLLEVRDDQQILHQAFIVYSALGDKSKSLKYSRQLHQAAPGNAQYLVDYIDALISAGQIREAGRLIDTKLKEGGTSSLMSSLYYLRSSIDTDSAAKLRDLQSALLQNLENESALIAMSRYYVQNGDLHSARRYAQQAQALLKPGTQLPGDLAKILNGGG